MKKTIYITILFCLAMGSLSAKKKDKALKAANDSIISVTENDTTQAVYVFSMISVGDVSFSSDSNQDNPDLDSVNVSDKQLNKKQIVNFFVQNVVYPNELKQKAAEDYLKIRFDIDKEGNVKNPKVLNSTYPEMEKEVLRVASRLSDFDPATKTEKSSKNKKKKKQPKDAEDTTVEVPISFRILKL